MSSCTSCRSLTLPEIEELARPAEIKNKSPLTPEIQTLIYEDLKNSSINSKSDFIKFVRDSQRKYHVSIGNPDVIYAYRLGTFRDDLEPNETLLSYMRKRENRSQSGVQVVTVFTSPYPEKGDGTVQEFSCHWKCRYCPSQPGQPKSYLLNEPGVRRANKNNFICIDQMRDRMKSYFAIGHPVDKLEVIVLGGTWASYPASYRANFVRDIYYAANTFWEHLREDCRKPLTLAEEIQLNETASCHVVGLSIETRPDCINNESLIEFRSYNVTKVLMGVQSIYDRYLDRISRGCHYRDTVKSLRLLKAAGFKVQIHIMFDLPQPLRASVDINKSVFEKEDIDWSVDVMAEDKRMCELLMELPEISADEFKLYPLMVTDWTEVKREMERGVYVSYGCDRNKMLEVMLHFMKLAKPWVRADRLIRDIPNEYIEGGTDEVNMGQTVFKHLEKEKIPSMEIRYREVKKKVVDVSQAVLKKRSYLASEGVEIFLSFETPDETTLLGFLRLRLDFYTGYNTTGKTVQLIFPEIARAAMIRELHVYGQTLAVNTGLKGVQHQGLGTRLVNEAISLAKSHGHDKIAVISGTGVRNYYRRFGFELEGNNNYMTRPI